MVRCGCEQGECGAGIRLLAQSLQVIVTSYLFPGAIFSQERLEDISRAVGKDKLVVDVRLDSPLRAYDHV